MQRTPESGLPADHGVEDSQLTDFRLAAEPGRREEYPFSPGMYRWFSTGRPATALRPRASTGLRPGER
jgi:hypothetical protein